MSLTGFHSLWDKILSQNLQPSPTKDLTWKDHPLIRGPLIEGYTVLLLHVIAEDWTRLKKECDKPSLRKLEGSTLCSPVSWKKKTHDRILSRNAVIDPTASFATKTKVNLRPLLRSGQVRSGQVRSGQVRSGQVRSGQSLLSKPTQRRTEFSRFIWLIITNIIYI
jgi:hypothetical protein